MLIGDARLTCAVLEYAMRTYALLSRLGREQEARACMAGYVLLLRAGLRSCVGMQSCLHCELKEAETEPAHGQDIGVKLCVCVYEFR